MKPVGDKALARQKFNLIAAILENFHFDFAALEDGQRAAVKAIVAKLLRSIRGQTSGDSEEAYAADGANLHVYVALVKIASSESSGALFQAWLPDGYSRIFRPYVFAPSGFWTMAPLRCAAKFDPFLSLDCAPHALHPGAIQGKEGIKFCHLATRSTGASAARPYPCCR